MDALLETIERCVRNRNSNSEVIEGTSRVIIAKDNGRRILTKESKDVLSLPAITSFGINEITDRALDGHGMRQLIKAQLGIDARVVLGLMVREARGHLRKIAIILEALDEGRGTAPGHTWRDTMSRLSGIFVEKII